MAKYFLASNANRKIAGQVFTIVSVSAGTMWGVFASENQQQEEELIALASSGSNGVFEISKAQYEAQLKKKALGVVIQTPNPSSVISTLAIKGVGAVEVAGNKDAEKPEPNPEKTPVIEDIQKALQLEAIQAETDKTKK